MEPARQTDFCTDIVQGDIGARIGAAPWGDYQGERNFTGFVGLALMTILKMRNRDRLEATKALVELAKKNVELLKPHTCGTLALSIFSCALERLGYPKTSKQMNTLVPRVPTPFTFNGPYITKELSAFVNGLLLGVTAPIASEKKMGKIIETYHEEPRRNSSDSILLYHCFSKSGPQEPLTAKTRRALLRIFPLDNAYPELVPVVQNMVTRAETGMWKARAQGVIGRQLLLKELKENFAVNFDIFLDRYKTVFKVNFKEYFPAIDTDPLQRLRLHVNNMDLLSEPAWAAIVDYIAAVSGKPQEALALLDELNTRLLGEEAGERAREIGAKVYKGCLLNLLKDNIAFFLDANHQNERSTVSFLIDKTDEAALLFPPDITALTTIFAEVKEPSPICISFYFSLVYPYLTRFHHPREGYASAMVLLNAMVTLNPQNLDKMVLCRDFLQMDFSRYPFIPDVAALLWPSLNLVPPNIAPFDLAQALNNFQEDHSLRDYIDILYYGALPQNRIMMQQYIAYFINETTQFAKEQADITGSHTEFCENFASVSGIGEGLLRLLTQIIPSTPPNYPPTVVHLQEKVWNFVWTVYPSLSTRHAYFIRELLALALKAPWITATVRYTFKMPEEAKCYDEAEKAEMNALLQQLHQANLCALEVESV